MIENNFTEKEKEVIIGVAVKAIVKEHPECAANINITSVSPDGTHVTFLLKNGEECDMDITKFKS